MREMKISLGDNVFDLIGRQWMLIAAKNGERYNMMTASWGGVGVLWNKNVATIYLRPQRYTLEFVDPAPCFSLSFFPEEKRDILTLCGSRSGRDMDKMDIPDLTPVYTEEGAVLFQEATLSLICRKLYRGKVEPGGFIDPSLNQLIYPQHDHHVVIVGEIIRVLGTP